MNIVLSRLRFFLDNPTKIKPIEVAQIRRDNFPSFNEVIKVHKKSAETVINPIVPMVRLISLISLVMHFPLSIFVLSAYYAVLWPKLLYENVNNHVFGKLI